MRRPNGLRTKTPVTPGLAAYIRHLTIIIFLLYSESAETKRFVFSVVFFALSTKRMSATQYFGPNPVSLLRLPANNYQRNYPGRRRQPDEIFLIVPALGLSDGELTFQRKAAAFFVPEVQEEQAKTMGLLH